MNNEIFLAVFFGLVAYRVVAPLIDFLNPLSFFTRSKGGASNVRHWEEVGRTPDHVRGGEIITLKSSK